MRITISGTAGSGKSTHANDLAKKLKIKHYSIGDLQRKIAKKRGISILELSHLEETDSSIDKELDQMQIDLGKKKDNFVIDGRLSGFFIPNSIKIFLDCELKERARRIMNDKKRKAEYSPNLEITMKNIEERKKSEVKRYKKYYGFNPYDKKQYDIVIDTTNRRIADVTKEILRFINKNKDKSDRFK